MEAAARVLGVLRELPGGREVAATLDQERLGEQLTACMGDSAADLALDGRVEMILRAAAVRQETISLGVHQVLSSLGIVRRLNRQSQLGRQGDPTIGRQEAMAAPRTVIPGQFSSNDVEPIVFALCRAGLIAVHCDKGGSGGSPWDACAPSHFFFSRTDALFQPWDPANDARMLCQSASRGRVLSAGELESRLGWGPRRLNPAFTYAELQQWIVAPYRRIADERYVLPYAYLTDAGRGLVES